MKSNLLLLLKQTREITILSIFLSILYYRSWFPISLAMGTSISVIISKVLKRIIRQPRPNDPTKYGMPSSHTQAMTFIMTFISLNLKNLIVSMVSLLIIGMVAWSRVSLGKHTIQQTIAGLIIGIAWAYSCVTIRTNEHAIKTRYQGNFTFNFKKALSNRSERVKAVDFHPTEPWLLSALYTGSIYVWNYETQALVKTFEAADLPIRAAKFIPRKNWIVSGSDDMHVRVFNYNTHEKVIAFEAHQDYIRSIAVHASQPFILTASDDMTIKLWDWEKGWKSIMTFEGHSHYVMQVAFNPKDPNSFASASLDRTIKIWSVSLAQAKYTLEGHQKGVNSVDFYPGTDKPYLITGADDKTVKVWDYQNKACVHTLEGHTQNVTIAFFHPELPIIISGSEDGTVRVWHSSTYRLENTLNYGMERAWASAYIKGKNDIAFGYDEGTISIKLGREEPAVSMDNGGKIIFAKHSEIFSSNIRSVLDESAQLSDGEKIQLQNKDLGTCEVFPQTLQHSPNGRFVVVCGDGEYIIYTALAWRNKSFGSAVEFVWAADSNEYAVRESTSTVHLFKAFKQQPFSIRTNFLQEGLFGGTLVGIKGSSFVVFYDWSTGAVVRRVDVAPKEVYWSENDYCAIVCEDSLFILKFNRVAFANAAEQGFQGVDEDGIEEAFEFITEAPEIVKSGLWIGDAFVFTTQSNRLCYLVGTQVSNIAHFDKNMYMLGYIPKENRIFLSDKDLNIVSYLFPIAVIKYETAILANDFESAQQLLSELNPTQRNKIARFLESQNLKMEALQVTLDLEHKFDLSLVLEKLEIAHEIAQELSSAEKYKAVADLALKKWQFKIAESCMRKAADFDGLFILYQSSGNLEAMHRLADDALAAGKNNIAFNCYLVCGLVDECIDILVNTARFSEAAFFARSFAPSRVSQVVKQWSHKQKLADPSVNPELFTDFSVGLAVEEQFRHKRANGLASANQYEHFKDSLDWNLIEKMKHGLPSSPVKIVSPRKEELEAKHAVDYISDTLSHVSMEVNTTGTGSVRGDVDFEETEKRANESQNLLDFE